MLRCCLESAIARRAALLKHSNGGFHGVNFDGAGHIGFRGEFPGDILVARRPVTENLNGQTQLPKLPQPNIPRKNVRIDSEHYLIRTIELSDASDPLGRLDVGSGS